MRCAVRLDQWPRVTSAFLIFSKPQIIKLAGRTYFSSKSDSCLLCQAVIHSFFFEYCAFSNFTTSFSLEPKESPKPQPIGSMLMIVLLTTCTLCLLFLLWRRADVLRRAVSHQLRETCFQIVTHNFELWPLVLYIQIKDTDEQRGPNTSEWR